MTATVAWLLLAATGLVWEVVCRLSIGRWPSLGTVGFAVNSRPAGWIALITMWAFVGWHLFARYTLPH